MNVAAEMWRVIEPIHAVTYFAPECEQGFKDIGLRGFWMGYFAGRSAPMGPVTAPVVTATFFNFMPAMVERAIPDAWTFASPDAVLEARVATASAVLRRVVPAVEDHARRALPLMTKAIDSAPCESLVRRGWLGADGALTSAGHEIRDDIERRTDELATAPYEALGHDAEKLLDTLRPVRDAVLDAEVLWFPNPIGLPREG
jgi:hypothetical protein